MVTPEKAAAMMMHTDLLITPTDDARAWKLTQAAAAKQLDIGKLVRLGDSQTSL